MRSSGSSQTFPRSEKNEKNKIIESVDSIRKCFEGLHDYECDYWPLQALLNIEASESARVKERKFYLPELTMSHIKTLHQSLVNPHMLTTNENTAKGL